MYRENKTNFNKLQQRRLDIIGLDTILQWGVSTEAFKNLVGMFLHVVSISRTCESNTVEEANLPSQPRHTFHDIRQP